MNEKHMTIWFLIVTTIYQENEFACGKSYIKGIECFWSYASSACIKKSRARFNHRDDDFASFVAKLFLEKSKIKKDDDLELYFLLYIILLKH